MATGCWSRIWLAHCADVAGEPSVEHETSLIGCPPMPPRYALTYETAASSAVSASGNVTGPDCRFSTPNTTGLPLAASGVPSVPTLPLTPCGEPVDAVDVHPASATLTPRASTSAAFAANRIFVAMSLLHCSTGGAPRPTDGAFASPPVCCGGVALIRWGPGGRRRSRLWIFVCGSRARFRSSRGRRRRARPGLPGHRSRTR